MPALSDSRHECIAQAIAVGVDPSTAFQSHAATPTPAPAHSVEPLAPHPKPSRKTRSTPSARTPASLLTPDPPPTSTTPLISPPTPHPSTPDASIPPTSTSTPSTSSTSHEISRRIRELQERAGRISEEELHFTKRDLIAILRDCLITPVGAIDEHHPLCQEMQRTRRMKGRGDAATEWETEKAKMPSKLDAAKLLATLCGWQAPQELKGNLTVSPSAEIDAALTKLLGG